MPLSEVAPIAAKAAIATSVERRLRAAGDDSVGLAALDHPLRLADRVGAGRAGRHHAERLPADVVAEHR